MDVRLVHRHVQLDPRAEQALGDAYMTGLLSVRGRHRVLRVARTVADLERCDRVAREHILTALALRQRTGSEPALAA
jgi:magnesium chelatase family protein